MTQKGWCVVKIKQTNKLPLDWQHSAVVKTIVYTPQCDSVTWHGEDTAHDKSGLWLIVRFISDSLEAICWERAVRLAFRLCCFNFSAVLVVHAPFPFGVWGRMWNSIVSVPDLCLFSFICFAKNLSQFWSEHLKTLCCCLKCVYTPQCDSVTWYGEENSLW